jgi:hypothetical protein
MFVLNYCRGRSFPRIKLGRPIDLLNGVGDENKNYRKNKIYAKETLKVFHFSLRYYDFLSNERAMLFISTTNRKQDVKNMINKKVNYTINQS